MLQVIRQEGWGGLYRGLAPSLVGTAASQVCALFIFLDLSGCIEEHGRQRNGVECNWDCCWIYLSIWVMQTSSIYTESGGQLLLSLDFFISGKMLFEIDQHTSVIFCFENFWNEVDHVLNASSHIWSLTLKVCVFRVFTTTSIKFLGIKQRSWLWETRSEGKEMAQWECLGLLLLQPLLGMLKDVYNSTIYLSNSHLS